MLTICKGVGALGLSIVGGQGHTSHPFGVDNPGVFISKVSTAIVLLQLLSLGVSFMLFSQVDNQLNRSVQFRESPNTYICVDRLCLLVRQLVRLSALVTASSRLVYLYIFYLK